MFIITLELRVVHINAEREGDNLGISNVRCSFEIPKVKSIKAGPSFVGVMRLVTGPSKGKERKLRNVWNM